MTMKRFAVFALLATVTATPVLAEATAAQRAACTPDVWRLCASEIPNVGAIKLCLRRERPKLSPACRTVMDEGERPAVATRAVASRQN